MSNMKSELSRSQARIIINKLGQDGTPPERGVKHFTVGMNSYLNVLNDEYLDTFLKDGASSFKLLVGDYGSGKTHFLYVLRSIAWEKNYVTSIVKLSPTTSPFDKLELVYKNIVTEIMIPVNEEENSTSDRGIENLLDSWFERIQSSFQISMKIDDPDSSELKKILNQYINDFKFAIESSSFKNAIKQYFRGKIDKDENKIEIITSWLKGEKVPPKFLKDYLIFEPLNKTTAFKFIRSLCQFVRDIEYNGLLLFFDEGERFSSISSSKARKIALDNLRQIVDESGNSRLPGSLVIYAITSHIENELAEYMALRDRLSSQSVLSFRNPSSVRIDIEKLDQEGSELLINISRKLSKIYEKAYNFNFEDISSIKISEFNDAVKELAIYTSNQSLSVNQRRLFVKSLITFFNNVRADKNIPSNEDITDILYDTAADLGD